MQAETLMMMTIIMMIMRTTVMIITFIMIPAALIKIKDILERLGNDMRNLDTAIAVADPIQNEQ